MNRDDNVAKYYLMTQNNQSKQTTLNVNLVKDLFIIPEILFAVFGTLFHDLLSSPISTIVSGVH